MRLLIIGPVRNFGNQTGGATVLFEDFVIYLDRKRIPYNLVVLNKFESKAKNLFYILKETYYYIGKVDKVFIHVSWGGVKYLSPLVFLLCKLYKKKYYIRVFGGNTATCLSTSSVIIKYLFKKTTQKADKLFFETINLVSKFSSSNIALLPNSRLFLGDFQTSNHYNKKYVYLGQIKKEKGVVEAKLAFDKLGKDYYIEFYGPIHDEELVSFLGVNYKGLLDPKNVRKSLANYNFLCLPTYWEGEGYPGVIIEAFSVGLPVVVTDWKQISEIVDNGVNGFLIEPKSVDSIVKVVKEIDQNVYSDCKAKAFSSSKLYDSNIIYKNLLKEIGIEV